MRAKLSASIMARPTSVALGLLSALAALTQPGLAAPPLPTAVGTGYDISFPQCGGVPPPKPYFVAVVGVNNGRPNTDNPCLAAEFDWARQSSGAAPALYVNTAYGQSTSGPRTCGVDLGCRAYDYGWQAALHAFRQAQAQGAEAATWWLDVETANTWSSHTDLNVQAIQGALDALRAQPGVTQVGAYSTAYQWNQIAGAYRPGIPSWVAGPLTLAGAALACDPSNAFAGDTVAMAQYPNAGYDGDWAC